MRRCRAWISTLALGGVLGFGGSALAASAGFVVTAPLPAPSVGEDDPGQAERQAAFDRVILRYPRVGRAGLLQEASACYGEAATLSAVRACYLLDLTTRMVDAHVKIVSRQPASDATDQREVDASAVLRLKALGITPDLAEIKRWSTQAGSRVTQQQREEVFAMLHEG